MISFIFGNQENQNGHRGQVFLSGYIRTCTICVFQTVLTLEIWAALNALSPFVIVSLGVYYLGLGIIVKYICFIENQKHIWSSLDHYLKLLTQEGGTGPFLGLFLIINLFQTFKAMCLKWYHDLASMFSWGNCLINSIVNSQ